jgi:uncharacterized protein YdaU (DUF1376 family)
LKDYKLASDKSTTLPVLPLYVRDHITATRHMSLAERGAYMDLLCIAWDSNEPLSKEPERLARLLGCSPKEFAKIWPAIRRKLTETPEGFISERLEAERVEAIDNKMRKTHKARLASQGRWGQDRNRNHESHSSASPSSAPSNASSMLQALHEECPPTPTPTPTPTPPIHTRSEGPVRVGDRGKSEPHERDARIEEYLRRGVASQDIAKYLGSYGVTSGDVERVRKATSKHANGSTPGVSTDD